MNREAAADMDSADLEQHLAQQLARGQALLRVGDVGRAEELGAELLERFPESTSAYEFMGDVLLLGGNSAKARAHFKRAMELEPANADAERKFASALLNLSQSELDRQMARNLVTGGVIAPPRDPDRSRNAVVAALLFPGLGQLYNRQYAKGLTVFVAAAVGLILLFNGLVVGPWTRVTLEAGDTPLPFSEQMRLVGLVVGAMATWYKLLLLLGLLGFLVVYAYCIYDAYTVSHAQFERGKGRA